MRLYATIAIALGLLLGASAHGTCALSTASQPQGVVGLQIFYPDRPQAWADAQDLGITWARVELRWDRFNPEPNLFDQEYTDTVFALAATQPNIRLLVLMNHAPLWAQSEPSLFPDRAAAAATWLIRRYGKQVSSLEVFNEPNLGAQFGWPALWGSGEESAKAYAKTLTAVSRAVRVHNKSVLIVTAGLSPDKDPESYARWLIRWTPSECYDGLGVHTYGQSGRFANIARNAGLLFAQEHVKNKPLWVTEHGTDNNSERAALLASLAAERSVMPIVFWFADRDIFRFTDSYGLIQFDGTRKVPDYKLFQRLVKGLPL